MPIVPIVPVVPVVPVVPTVPSCWRAVPFKSDQISRNTANQALGGLSRTLRRLLPLGKFRVLQFCCTIWEHPCTFRPHSGSTGSLVRSSLFNIRSQNEEWPSHGSGGGRPGRHGSKYGLQHSVGSTYLCPRDHVARSSTLPLRAYELQLSTLATSCGQSYDFGNSNGPG